MADDITIILEEATEALTLTLTEDAIDLTVSDAAQGVAGLSAYAVAVVNGYVGTEEEWLASLKGDKGDIGPAGPPDETVAEDLAAHKTASNPHNITRSTVGLGQSDTVRFDNLILPGLVAGTTYRLIVDADGMVGTEQIT